MNPPSQFFFEWPELPPLPPPGEPVLIRVPVSSPRRLARQELRMVLRRLLTRWNATPPQPLPLFETLSGPKHRSAGFQTCCIADFQIGRPSKCGRPAGLSVSASLRRDRAEAGGGEVCAPVPGPNARPMLAVEAISESGRAGLPAGLDTRQRVPAGFKDSLRDSKIIETPHGPQWPGPLAGHGLDISLSYCDGEGWIGLLRGGSIGVDAMRVQPVPEAEALARHYLGPDIWAAIQKSPQPEKTFALAWTQCEARLKCLKLGLTELDLRPAVSATCVSRQFFFAKTAITLVTTNS